LLPDKKKNKHKNIKNHSDLKWSTLAWSIC